MKFSLTTFSFASATFLVLVGSTGCRKENTRWEIVDVQYRGATVTAYWKCEVYVDKGSLIQQAAGHNNNIHVVRSSYLQSTINLISRESIEEAITGDAVRKVAEEKLNRTKNFSRSTSSDGPEIVDVSLNGGWALGSRIASARPELIGQGGTNQLQSISPFSSGCGAVNENGECVSFRWAPGSRDQAVERCRLPFVGPGNGGNQS